MSIQLAFQNEILRKVCESPISANRRYGISAGILLHTRIADLKAADSPSDLVKWGLAHFAPEGHDQIIIPLEDGYSLHIMSNHKLPPVRQGKLDWAEVTRIKILSIERVNEK